jgi:putative phosphoesterase
MKIAVFADIHSNYPVFMEAYKDALSNSVDMFLFLGDNVTDGFDGNKILDIIKNSNGYSINGNRELSIIDYDNNKDERWNKYLQFRSMKYGYECLSKENIEYLKGLPIYKILNIANKKICISHCSPYDVRGTVGCDSYDIFDKLIEDYDCDIYLFGHEHVSYYTEYKNRYFINPGSLGIPTNGCPFSYGLLTINDNIIDYKRVDIMYDYDKLEGYYRNSDYYKEATIWCSLLLLNMKTKENHVYFFINDVYKKAEEKNIDISEAIPDDLFISIYQEYMENNNKSI